MQFQILKCCEEGCSYTTSGRSAHPLKDLREHYRTKHSLKEVERGECIKITNPFLGTIRRCAGTNCNVDSDKGLSCPARKGSTLCRTCERTDMVRCSQIHTGKKGTRYQCPGYKDRDATYLDNDFMALNQDHCEACHKYNIRKQENQVQ